MYRVAATVIGIFAVILTKLANGKAATMPPIAGLQTQDKHGPRIDASSIGIDLTTIGQLGMLLPNCTVTSFGNTTKMSVHI